MDIKKLQAPLTVEQIDFRVQSVTSDGKGVIVLAYKNARVDMERLDDVVGPLNWKREHTRDNKNCIVSIRDEEKKQWVSKEDTGTESQTDKEKGLASDSFKRACFNWGIGRELYDFPFIYITPEKGEVYEVQGKWRASNSFMRNRVWTVDNKEGKTIVTAQDANGKLRYSSGGGVANQTATTATATDDKPRFNQEQFDKFKLGILAGKINAERYEEGKKIILSKYKLGKQMGEALKMFYNTGE